MTGQQTCLNAPCKQPATVILERDGQPYCRPCGLGKAVWKPRCDIYPIPATLDLERTHGIGRCVDCQSVVRYARLDGELVALDWGALNRQARAGDLAYNPGSHGAARVTAANVQQIHEWVSAGRVQVYTDHGPQCVGPQQEVAA